MYWTIGLLTILFIFRRPIVRALKSAAAEAAASAEADRAAHRAREQARVAHRDADTQSEPYVYQCAGHPNATLAIRYGIANLESYVEEYWYNGPGGVQERNPARDKVKYRPATKISLRKVRRLKHDHYLAELPDYGNRDVHVVIEPGTEVVKTFYPISDRWFEDHKDLEQVLKDNKTFNLKELATFHVQKVVKAK